ncbi:MAG: thioredoxin family protein [Prolixibacteraceae bacterium]|nr:thioredoxin family protein [Prolixibacteraceae bacterium]
MKEITDVNCFEKAREENPLVLAYFSGQSCNVCNALKPKIEMLVEQQFPTVRIFEVKAEKAPVLASRYTVFTVPVVLFFVDGREYIRETRNVSVSELAQKMDKIVRLYEGE